MRARRLLAVSLLTVLTAGCGGVPKVTPSGTAAPSSVPTIGPGTVMTDALTEARCVQASDGTWTASGVVKNTTKKTRSFDVNIYIGPPGVDAAVASVVAVEGLAAGKSAPWNAPAVQPTSADGPCHLRVRIAK
jgi:hypothetical protein